MGKKSDINSPLKKVKKTDKKLLKKAKNKKKLEALKPPVAMASTVPVPQPASLTFNTYLMPNSISFSSDMTKLYLIDCERNICFDLVNTNGIMIGTVKGQIFAVSSPTTQPTKIDKRKSRRLKLPTKNAQFTLMYNPDQIQMFIIGFDDLDGSISIDDKPTNADSYSFDIKDHVVIIRRINAEIEITYTKR